MKDQNQQEQNNIYEEELRKDSEAIESYINNIYGKAVPSPQPPKKDELSFWKIAGLESSLFALSALGAAVLSAVRTGGIFLLIEILLIEKFNLNPALGNIFGIISMAASLLAFEGFLIAYGLQRGRDSGKMKVSKIGLGISLFTIIAAGIFSSFSIVSVSDTNNNSINIFMAIVTGAASALVAFFSSENLGYIRNHVTQARNDILFMHQASYEQWREKGVRSYLSSIYNIRHKNSDKIYKNISYVQSSVQNEQKIEQQEDKKLSKVELARNYVEKQYRKTGKIPVNREIAKAVNISTGSAFKGINQFIIENQDELLEKKIVTKDQINKAITNLNTNIDKIGFSPQEEKNFIREYIDINKKFPSAEILRESNISAQSIAEYVKENRDFILVNNLLSKDIVDEAIRQANVP